MSLMHILQINTEKGWRGGERQTLLSMEGLREAGVGVTLLCLRGQPLCSYARQAGFAVVEVGSQLGALRHLLCSGRQYSVLHAQSSRAFGFAAIASLVVPVPLVYTRRADFVPRGTLARMKYRRADALVAISGAIRDTLKKAEMGSATVISSIVPDRSPDPAKSALLRQKLHLDGKRIVGVVAMLSKEKDPLTMLRAAAVVVKRLPDVMFLHFGEGALRKDVEDERQSLNIGQSYHLLGYCDDAEDYFPLFDCFAMSSREEGLGSSVLDAFKCSVPVAATSAGGLAELVAGRGLLCAPGDAETLGVNICNLLTNKEFAAGFAASARSYVHLHHDRAVLTQRYVTLYERLTSPHP